MFIGSENISCPDVDVLPKQSQHIQGRTVQRRRLRRYEQSPVCSPSTLAKSREKIQSQQPPRAPQFQPLSRRCTSPFVESCPHGPVAPTLAPSKTGHRASASDLPALTPRSFREYSLLNPKYPCQFLPPNLPLQSRRCTPRPVRSCPRGP